MKPEANALKILSTTRATAKMHEFRVAPEDFIALPRDPAILFSLAIGILGDVAAGIADGLRDDADIRAIDPLPVPFNWGDADPSPLEGLRFSSVFFDAFLNARLDDTITPELSLLCASAYYLAGNVGSAAVVARQMEPPPLTIAGGLGFLVYAILTNRFEAIDEAHVHTEMTTGLLDALGRFFHFEGEAIEVETRCNELRTFFYRSGSPRELLYTDLAGAICAHKQKWSRLVRPRA